MIRYGMADGSRCGARADYALLGPEHNFIVFFSLPFLPQSRVYKKSYFVYGHLAIALGDTVYQLHDPGRLRSSFLVSRMPLQAWLFSDGPWFDPDAASPTYRHVHLYEAAEVSRTAVFFAGFKNFPVRNLLLYERYLERIESTFQQGRFRFNLLFNNCTQALNNIFYREQWIEEGLFDFIPAVSFKRLVKAWQRKGLPFVAGRLNESNPARFKIHPFCCGLLTLSPERTLARWMAETNMLQQRT